MTFGERNTKQNVQVRVTQLHNYCDRLSSETLHTCTSDYLYKYVFLLPMCKQVCLKTVTSSKSLLTDVTFMWPVSSMCQHVRLKSAKLSILLLTNATFVWLCTRM